MIRVIPILLAILFVMPIPTAWPAGGGGGIVPILALSAMRKHREEDSAPRMSFRAHGDYARDAKAIFLHDILWLLGVARKRMSAEEWKRFEDVRKAIKDGRDDWFSEIPGRGGSRIGDALVESLNLCARLERMPTPKAKALKDVPDEFWKEASVLHGADIRLAGMLGRDDFQRLAPFPPDMEEKETPEWVKFLFGGVLASLAGVALFMLLSFAGDIWRDISGKR